MNKDEMFKLKKFLSDKEKRDIYLTETGFGYFAIFEEGKEEVVAMINVGKNGKFAGMCKDKEAVERARDKYDKLIEEFNNE